TAVAGHVHLDQQVAPVLYRHAALLMPPSGPGRCARGTPDPRGALRPPRPGAPGRAGTTIRPDARPPAPAPHPRAPPPPPPPRPLRAQTHRYPRPPTGPRR